MKPNSKLIGISKIFDSISKCKTEGQLNSTETFLELWHRRFKDNDTYKIMKDTLNIKKKEICVTCD
jgi:hypothetical protein